MTQEISFTVSCIGRDIADAICKDLCRAMNHGLVGGGNSIKIGPPEDSIDDGYPDYEVSFSMRITPVKIKSLLDFSLHGIGAVREDMDFGSASRNRPESRRDHQDESDHHEPGKDRDQQVTC